VVEHLKAQEIASYKLPERIEVRDSLPRNPVGKVLKRQLRDELADNGASAGTGASHVS
jgi:acyl-CoA synthetase (AMP-forming)/AMP-acid ligase II